MVEPWALAQQFIGNLQQQAAQSRNTADNVLMKMMGANIGRQDAATAQGYGLETLGERNRYATIADTTAFDRQLQRDDTAYSRDDARFKQKREFDVADGAAAARGRTDNLILEQRLIAEREAAARGDIPSGPRRFGAFNEAPSTSSYESGTVGKESGGDRFAKNPRSSATGHHQFLAGTWSDVMKAHPELGLTVDGRTDAAQSSRAFKAFTNDNVRVLQANGIEPTNGNKYAAHFLGAGGAVRALRQPDNTPMSAVVGADVLKANPFLGRMTVGSFKQFAASKYQGDDSGEETTARRYTSGPTDISHSDTVLGSTVPNSAGNMTETQVAPVSDTMQAFLDKNGLEAVKRVTLTEQQLNMIQDQATLNSLIPDIGDTTTMGRKGSKAEYIVVQPRQKATDDPKAGGLPTPKKTTEAEPIAVQDAPRRVFRNGKFVTDDGGEINLPD